MYVRSERCSRESFRSTAMKSRMTTQQTARPMGRGCIALAALAGILAGRTTTSAQSNEELNAGLRHVLTEAGFTGRVEASLPTRLGRPLDPNKVELGRLL